MSYLKEVLNNIFNVKSIEDLNQLCSKVRELESRREKIEELCPLYDKECKVCRVAKVIEELFSLGKVKLFNEVHIDNKCVCYVTSYAKNILNLLCIVNNTPITITLQDLSLLVESNSEVKPVFLEAVCSIRGVLSHLVNTCREE